jgi:hypothetical protein
MAAGEQPKGRPSYHGPARRAEGERGERTGWTIAGAVLMLVVAIASASVLVEAVLSLLVRLSIFWL